MNTLTLKNVSRRSKFSLSGAFSAACLYAAIFGSFHAMFSFSDSVFLPMLIGFGVIAAAWLMRKCRSLSLIFGMGLMASCIIGISFFGLLDGLSALFNCVFEVLGAHLGLIFSRYAVTGEGRSAASVFLAVLLASACIRLICTRNLWIVIPVAVCIFALDLLLNVSAVSLWLMLLTFSILLMLFPKGFMTHDASAQLTAWFCIALISGTIFCGSYCFLERFEIPHADRLHDSILNRIEDIRFGKTTLPNGDFTDLGSKVSSSETMLEITMSQPESLYLRGFVGSEYHADGWKVASAFSLSDSSDLFFWLHQDNFYGQTQMAHLSLLLDDTLNADDAIEITIQHIGESRRYVYSPYELMASDLLDSNAFGDVDLKTHKIAGIDCYTLNTLPNQVKRYSALLSLLREAEDNASDELNGYLLCEGHYNAYVYTHFLSIADTEYQLFSELLGSVDFQESAHLDYGEAKQRILDFLNENIRESETVSPRLEDSDFLDEFLNIHHNGYDIHYATAAVMMMRYFGIPARYVEGYLITPADAENMSAGVPFPLSSERAHAWCEYYQDGIGWIPFEVTPSYLNLMERSDLSSTTPSPSEFAQPEEQPETAEENSLDMEEDFHDDFEDEETLDDTLLPLGWVRSIIETILALFLLFLLVLFLTASTADLRRRHSFRLKDRRKAVVNLYAYLFALMKEIYRWPNCIAPSGFCATVRADQGEDAATKYQKLIEIGEASAFSERNISQSDYRFVYNYVRKTRLLLKKRCSCKQWLILRYFRHTV